MNTQTLLLHRTHAVPVLSESRQAGILQGLNGAGRGQSWWSGAEGQELLPWCDPGHRTDVACAGEREIAQSYNSLGYYSTQLVLTQCLE